MNFESKFIQPLSFVGNKLLDTFKLFHQLKICVFLKYNLTPKINEIFLIHYELCKCLIQLN